MVSSSGFLPWVRDLLGLSKSCQNDEFSVSPDQVGA